MFKQRRDVSLKGNLGLLVVIVGVSCSPNRHAPGRFIVVNRAIYVPVDFIGRKDITASCAPGEQMLGGGYEIPFALGERYSLNDWNSTLSIESSYPSDQNQWTVTVLNPDKGLGGHNSDKRLRVDCYCLTAPDFPVDIAIVSETRDIEAVSLAWPPDSYALEPTGVSVVCPNGVLTAGGFRTPPLDEDPIYSHLCNAYITASMPTRTSGGLGNGWTVKLYNLAGGRPTLRTTVYALCAGTNLTAGRTTFEIATYRNAYGWDLQDASTHCSTDEMTTGGGFEFIGGGTPPWAPWEVPHQVFHSVAIDTFIPHREGEVVDAFNGWHIGGVYGQGLPGVIGGHAPAWTTGSVNVWRVPIKVPVMPPYVKIDCPAGIDVATCGFDGDCLYEDRSNPGHSSPQNFHATGIDGSGLPLIDDALQWYVTRTDEAASIPRAIASGEYMTHVFAYRSDHPYVYHVRVVATGVRGDTAEDSITVTSGCKPPD